MENKDTELTRNQIGAITRSIKLGRILQQEHSEIADLYKQNYILSQIVRELNIPSDYGVSRDIAWTGVRLAIAGHPGFLGIDSYDGLIKDSERKIISREHHQEMGRKAGKKNYEEKKGIHGKTSEERREYARKGGRTVYEKRKGWHGRTPEQMSKDGRKGGLKSGPINGPMSYKLKKGIHGRTPEQKREDGSKGVIAKGFTLWTEEEISLAYQLSQQPEYQHSEGRHKGRSNLKKITSELVKRGHSERVPKSVCWAIGERRKSLENKV